MLCAHAMKGFGCRRILSFGCLKSGLVLLVGVLVVRYTTILLWDEYLKEMACFIHARPSQNIKHRAEL